MSIKRPIEADLKFIKENKHLFPSLQKKARRKTLKPGERGWITRRIKQLRSVGPERIVPLTARQARALPNKAALIGKGIRGIKLDSVAEGAKATMVRGRLKVTSGERHFEYVNVTPDLVALLVEGERQFGKGVKQIWTWTVQGRSIEGWTSFAAMSGPGPSGLPAKFLKYEKLFQNWLLGLVVTYDEFTDNGR